MTEYFDICLLAALLAAAVWTDHTQHRIPNGIVLLTLTAGITVQIFQSGLGGLAAAAAGVVAGLVVFLIPYAKGGMAAGDVKLLAALGSFLGPVYVLVAGGIALMIGGLSGSALLAYQQSREGGFDAAKLLSAQFPFAACIAFGVAAALILRGTLWA